MKLVPLPLNQQNPNNKFYSSIKEVYSKLFHAPIEDSERGKFQYILTELLSKKSMINRQLWIEGFELLKEANYIEFDPDLLSDSNSYQNIKKLF